MSAQQLRIFNDPFPGNYWGDIDIDANGNGTISYGHWWHNEQLSHSGTRTVTESSVSWEGTRSAYDGDFRHNNSFTNTISIIDENTGSFVQEFSGSNVGTFNFTWETSANFTAEAIDGSSRCRLTVGTFFGDYRSSPIRLSHQYDISASKALDDAYWRSILRDFNTSSDRDESINTREYFVREFLFSYWDSQAGYEM